MPSKGSVTLRKALTGEAEQLSELAQRSKAYWGYSSEFMAACVDELTWSEADLCNPRFSFIIAATPGKSAGFYATKKRSEAVYELEALFVKPEYIGRGVGRTLIQHAITALQQTEGRTLSIQGDPNAEAFYLAAGGRKVGDRPSGSIPGRTLPLFEIVLNDRKLDLTHPESS